MPLVLESEWMYDYNSIKIDFEKLLVVNADHRVMICYPHTELKEQVWKYFPDAIQKYKNGRAGDRFMIAMMDYRSFQFEFKLFVRK